MEKKQSEGLRSKFFWKPFSKVAPSTNGHNDWQTKFAWTKDSKGDGTFPKRLPEVKEFSSFGSKTNKSLNSTKLPTEENEDDRQKGDDYPSSSKRLAEIEMSLRRQKGRRTAPKGGKYRSGLHKFIVYVVNHTLFTSAVMLTILVNIITVATQTSRAIAQKNVFFFDCVDTVSLMIYFMEFVLKLYAEPRGYWKSSYNRFDAIILFLSIFNFVQDYVGISGVTNVKYLRVLRALRALRALRGIAFVSALQVIVTAIVKTLSSVLNLILLLFLIMYVFGVMAYYFFGADDTGGDNYWTSLDQCLFSLFDWVTADNWTVFTEALEQNGVYSIRYFAVGFIFVGHFIFTNLFIGVVIQNLEEATEEENRLVRERREAAFKQKKQVFLEKQEQELKRLLEAQAQDHTLEGLQQILRTMAGRLRHDDLVPMNHLSCNLVWMETFMATLEYQENAMYRSQQLHFEMARVLAELVQRRLQASVYDEPAA